jgi:hypothetical protein
MAMEQQSVAEHDEQQVDEAETKVKHHEATVVAWARFRDPSGASWSVTLREGATGKAAAKIVQDAESLSTFLLGRGWKVG